MFMGQGLEQTQHMVLRLEYFKTKLENKPFTIVGNGNQKRDFVYVKDVCEAFGKSLFQILKMKHLM